jgi:HlyD family secretion protein
MSQTGNISFLKRPYIIVGIIVFLIHCSSHKDLNQLQTYTVIKSDFINAITVSGVLEATNSYTIQCPGINQDLRITWLVPEGIMVHKGETLCILQCAELENIYDDAIKKLEMVKSDFEKARAQQQMENNLLESQVKSIEASTMIAMLDSSRLDYYSPAQRKIAELRLEKAGIEKTKIEHKIGFLKRINEAELQEIQLKINIQQNIANEARMTLNKLILKADTSGIVDYTIRFDRPKVKVGDIVWSIRPLMRLIDLSKMQVRLLVNEANFKSIQKDQNVDIYFDSYNNFKLKGKIIQKIPAGKPLNEGSIVKFFEIIVSLDSTIPNLQPGVSVECNIYINVIKNTLAVPIMSVFEFDSSKVVYLIGNRAIRRQVVETGISSDKQVLIIKGLKKSDRILLTEPPAYLLE